MPPSSNSFVRIKLSMGDKINCFSGSWITNLELSVGDKIDGFVYGFKPKIRERVVDPFNEGGRWEDFKRLLTYAVVMDAIIEQSCPKEMQKNPPKLSGYIRKYKGRDKAMTLSNEK